MPSAQPEEGSGDRSASGSASKDTAQEDKKKLDEEALPLVKRGVATGATLAFQTPTPWDAAASVKRLASTPIVYVGILPGYVYAHDQDEVNAYCTTNKNVANRERAERLAIRRALHEDIPAAELMTPEHAQQRAMVAAKTGWEVGARPSCGFWRRVGFIVALPTSFWTDVERHGVRQNVEVHPILGLGLVVAPLPWLHVIAGITLSNAATGAPGEQLNHLTPTPFIGVGVPLEITTRVLK